MRLTTVIGLLLFACAPCALHLYHEVRRDGFQSSIIPRHSLQPISRRRLGSRRIGSLRTPDIVPRGNKIITYCIGSNVLKDLKRNGKVTKIAFGVEVEVYVVHLPSHTKPVVVKEIHLGKKKWIHERMVQDEARGLRNVDQLDGVLVDDSEPPTTYFILMKDMGSRWTEGFPDLMDATVLIQRANIRYGQKYNMERVFRPDPHNRDIDVYNHYQYAWIRYTNGTWEANPVGRWRYWALAGFTPSEHIPKDRHYCGIEKWTEDNLPVFSKSPNTRHVQVGH